ncbi:hypothetical protein ACPW96_21295 [Micromonospora sp. DT81.3]|uniref:hypothetical protein n=1 Tax=Micromonospora sp. DT81.3 TaxID=3416523 RepID=UPI003CFA5D50
MIKEWMSEEVALAKMRVDFLRMRMSTFARDQFRKGFRAGYKAGRRDERAGARDVTEPYRSEPHPQVEVDGIEVDEGMRVLLVALWNLGLDTQYSCQGHPDKFGPHQGYSRTYASQIVFGNVEHAFKFLKKSAELLGSTHHGEDGFVLHTMSPLEDGTPRAEVTFSPVLLPELTHLWTEFEPTVPRAAATTDTQEANV